MGFPLKEFELFEEHNIILFCTFVSINKLYSAAINKEGQMQPIQIPVFLFS